MLPTINYQSIDICSFNHASDWPTFDASSTQLIWCCPLLQNTVVVSFIIGCLISLGQLCCKLDRPKCHLGCGVNVGNVLYKKTDAECFCCREHDLLADRFKTLICATDIATGNLEAYSTQKSSLEMAYIDRMIKRYLKGPAATELSNW